jgi:Na+/melibiose symporter-like transporter
METSEGPTIVLATPPETAARTIDRGPSRSIGRLLAYALPNFSISMLVMPIATIVPTLYVKERGVALVTMGVILAAARIFDAVADQIIGYLSDITQGRMPGGRKGWMLLGGLVAGPSVFFLCVPPRSAGTAYFTLWSLAAYLAWAMLLIPYTAWGAELSRDYHERTRIATVRSAVGQAGTLLFLVTPLLLAHLHVAATTEINFNSLRYVAFAIVILLPLTLLPAALFVPQGVCPAAAAPPSIGATVRALLANRPMRIYAGSFLLSELGYGVFASVIFLYLDAYLGLGAKFSQIIIISGLTTLISLPAWAAISRRIDKKQSMALSWLGQAAALFALLLVPRGPAGLIPVSAVIAVSSAFAAAAAVVSPSILGDIVDYDTLKTHGYRAGNYFALYGLVLKVVVALGGGVAFVVLGLLGYSVSDPASNGPSANRAMLVVFCIAPAVLRLVSLAILWRYPLDARRQQIISRRLGQREQRDRAAVLGARGGGNP